MLDSLTRIDLLFGVVFVSQICLVSIYFPWTLRHMSEQLEREQHPRVPPLRAYSLLNTTISLSGLCLLAALLHFGAATHMTAIFLSIGAYFLLQLSPLANSRIRRLSASLRSTTETQSKRAQLFAFVGHVQVALAALLIAGYLIFAASRWTGDPNTHLLKMTIFAGTQLLFAVSIGWNLLMLNRESGEIAAKRYRNLVLSAPLLIRASIMISVYYFGKELIAVFDLNPMRPAMMSAFLQVLALLTFGALFPRRQDQGDVGQ